MPPLGPVTPGGFDYGRMLWFERIGRVGFIITTPQLLNMAPQDRFPKNLLLRLTVLRDHITARIIAAIPGDAGVMSAALMTGDRAHLQPCEYGHNQFRAGASDLHFRPAYRHGGGDSVFFPAYGSGAAGTRRPSLSDQEMIGRICALWTMAPSADFRRIDARTALLHDDRNDTGRRGSGQIGHFHAHHHARRQRHITDITGKPAQRHLSDVVCRRDRAGRIL